MKLVLVGGVIGYVGSMLLIAALGPAWGCGIIGLTFGAAYVGHTERSKWLVGLFLAAVDRHMARKCAAIAMGIQASQISRWDSGEEQASLNRLAELPNDVLVDAVTPLLEGLGFVVVPSGRLASATAALLKWHAAVDASAQSSLSRQEVRAG